MSSGPLTETVTLSQARDLIRCLSHEQSVLLLAPPGVGKSDVVRQAAAADGLECRSLLGTQIAPEDVSGVPRIVGERSVFCPPRVLLPETAGKFCLFLDELPACAPDVQKAFYSLLLERRIGEYLLPEGTWVVAAGNRAEDKALVRTISSALINRVLVLNVRIDVPEWLEWARANRVREDVIQFIEQSPEALLRPVPDKPVPFSTPRAWASLARALDLVGARGRLTAALVRALAVGRVSEDDARRFAAAWLGNPAESASLEEKLNWPLAQLELSVRATTCLESEGITVVRELIVRTDDELLEIRNFSETALREVRAKLALHGLRLGTSA
ncbi:DNA-directed RNA polymerase subunit alpha C-terminal domain-containing protein [Frigoriglobus tundricola]|uniref:AAA_5 domain-containing protein n=1 Tax=Frigoriglobus tundricola TaxID=2774151 RepID=A0A6M5YT91_9BACT|nr:DNA-directed RNA polymerase subunit alpha C-terminal domain-containing protein [Frigoriglobus tundricola]QJW97307.1 AAA_5 domain-containing protein [Frigoriglobus tundricola]